MPPDGLLRPWRSRSCVTFAIARRFWPAATADGRPATNISRGVSVSNAGWAGGDRGPARRPRVADQRRRFASSFSTPSALRAYVRRSEERRVGKGVDDGGGRYSEKNNVGLVRLGVKREFVWIH